jgi:hypothetical protein
VKVEDVRGWLESQLRAAEPSAPTAAQCARIALAALDVADYCEDAIPCPLCERECRYVHPEYCIVTAYRAALADGEVKP